MMVGEKVICDWCDGTGRDWETEDQTACPDCDGTGEIEISGTIYIDTEG